MSKSPYDIKNFVISTIHPIYGMGSKHLPFRGGLPEVKKKCEELLASHPEPGWSAKAETDGELIYSTKKE